MWVRAQLALLSPHELCNVRELHGQLFSPQRVHWFVWEERQAVTADGGTSSCPLFALSQLTVKIIPFHSDNTVLFFPCGKIGKACKTLPLFYC